MREIKATPLSAAHVVCKECGTRWTVAYQEGRTTPQTPRECKSRECDAGWMEIAMFWDEADAGKFATERVAVMREP